MNKQILNNEASGIFQVYLLVIICLWMWAKGAFEKAPDTGPARKIIKTYKEKGCTSNCRTDSRNAFERVVDMVKHKYYDIMHDWYELKESTKASLERMGRSIERQFEEDTAAISEKINQALEYADSILSGLW